MPKFYLHRVGKIPTAVHPFVKQAAFPQDKYKPRLLPGKMIRGVQNLAMSMFKMIYIAIAPWAAPFGSIASRGWLRHLSSDLGRATSKPLDRLQK
ncbi:MAG: hypothetical protein RM368_22105 [Nostoc sp. DedSLP03]|uniref:hypothetical protein n=1 Tax=Nostoc sp. DedSLP03 TaxID=3075400 RepID=UPI002AD41556|nr:hypothetical protein [Nostoc sp. DedSLP03]MDZ7967611.1 hypothetical protein [Nostoc sp. DedSLP03]